MSLGEKVNQNVFKYLYLAWEELCPLVAGEGEAT